MRMRIILAILASVTFLSSKAQLYLPSSQLNYPLPSNQKWQLSHYASLSAGYVFTGSHSALFSGGASYISAPVGLQLSRELNKNLYAFTGISVAPTFFSFNRLYTQPVNSSYPGSYLSRPYGAGLNSRVEMGLMYVNDAKTFSISGSVGIERGGYPVYPTNRANTKKQ